MYVDCISRKTVDILSDLNFKFVQSISGINFCNKGSGYVCSGGSGQVVRVWDLQSKRYEHVASVSCKGEVIVHNLVSGAKASNLKDPHAQVLEALDYSRICRHLLVTAGDEGSIHLWDTTGHSPKVSWSKQHSAPTTGVAFSPTYETHDSTLKNIIPSRRFGLSGEATDQENPISNTAVSKQVESRLSESSSNLAAVRLMPSLHAKQTSEAVHTKSINGQETSTPTSEPRSSPYASPKSKKTGSETREDILNNLLSNSQPPTPTTPNGRDDLMLHKISLQSNSSIDEETLASFRESINGDMQNLQLNALL
ncbi:hypothetical protein SASPL_120779 [Salvia splendens]|uniref:Protein NEDD1 n=1 Tax=Salvia splendens TaxID=180675 RepID=A0A8X8XQA3_SALSN|nr:hypothetical protein SASPL_120779 [Salvia splendens]